MVIRVNADGSMMPFEIMPELFLGRSIRQLLTGEVREQFDQACRDVIETETASVFCPTAFAETDEVMITPVFDDDVVRCQFLVVWARNAGEDAGPVEDGAGLQWQDLALDAVEIRYRAIDTFEIEAAPWWGVGSGIHLWDHHHRVASVGLAPTTMGELVTEALCDLADHDRVRLRLDVPSAEMLPGLLQVLHGTLRATGVNPDRVTLGIPVELAVDPDLLPVIVHLRTLGLRIDIVGLDALTAKLHTVSDTSDHQHRLPAVSGTAHGDWSTEMGAAVRDSAHL